MLMKSSYLLTAPEPEDLDFVFRIENDPVTWPLSDGHMPYSRYALRQYLLTCKNDFFAEKQLRLMVRPSDSRQAVAIVDLFNFSPIDGRAEVGIIVAPELRGQGIGTEAVSLLCDYVGQTLGLRMLAAYVPVTNEASLRLFAKCGFERVATLPEWSKIDSKWCDLAILRKKV